MKTVLQKENQPALVLTKALIRLMQFYDLTGKELSQIIGISEATISRLHQGKVLISPTTKEGEIAILLLRVYRGLNALLGNNHEKAKLWLHSDNAYFSQKPISLLKSLPGLVQVVNYIDAMRGTL